MAAYFHSSLHQNLPIILNLDNPVTLTPENFPIVLPGQMNFGKSDQQEKNFSLDDLCKAATSDILASNNKADNSRSCLSMALCSNDFQLQSKNIFTGIIKNVVPTGNEDVCSESKHFHLKDKHNDKHKCEYCGKICAKPSILQKHIRAHTNERPYPCEECGVQFKTKSNLYKHCKSRSHLIQTATLKDTGDRSVEKLSPSMQSSAVNDKLDVHENTSSSCDYQDDVSVRPQGSVFLVNQLGQVILKPLSHIGMNSSTFNSASAPSLSPKPLSMECVEEFTNTNCPRPLLKSFSEKGQSKATHRVKPHSQSFSNEAEAKHIPKLDKTMTSDDIQRRISLIISLNDTIIDTPKEIKNHRIRKIVRDHSDGGGNSSQNSCSGKFVTRSNSITPTLPSSDSFVNFCQTSQSVASKSPSLQHSTFISAPISCDKQLWSFIPSRTDARQSMAIQEIKQYSLPTTGSLDVNELGSFTKAHSFGNTQTILVSKSDSSLKTLNIAFDQDLANFLPGPIQETIKRNALENSQLQMWSQSLDANNSNHSPAVSPSSSSISSTSHRPRLKRGRPKGSRNKLKSPVSSMNSIQPIIPSIHITSVNESPPPESQGRKELKRHLLMKRSMSNENSADKDQTTPTTAILQAPSTLLSSSVDSFSTSCPGIQHLSPSSIPIKKRRKTLTELGRGTAFGTTVDDHNIDSNASNRPKNMTKPLWSSDGSFGKTVLSDENDVRDLKQFLLDSSKEVYQNASTSASNDPKESNFKMLTNTSLCNSCNSKSFTKFTDDTACVNVATKSLDSNASVNILKEDQALSSTCYTGQATQAFQKSENVITKCQSESVISHLLNPSNLYSEIVTFNQLHASDGPTHDPTDISDVSEKMTTDLIPVNSPCNQRFGNNQSIMHLKFKRFSQLEQRISKSTECNIANFCGSNSTSIESVEETGTNRSSNYNLVLLPTDDSLLRARLDSEAAASLLDLSKSRQSPTICDEPCTSGKYNSSMPGAADSNYSNMLFIPDARVGMASSTEKMEVSSKNTYQPVISAPPRDRNEVRHFFSSSSIIAKNYNFIESKHVCNICQKVFPKEHSLLLHKNVHYMEKPHRCGKCQATFQSNWLLKRHQNISHHLSKSLIDPRPFKCIECKVAFRTRGHLAKHARSKLHSLNLTSKLQYDKQVSDSSDAVDEQVVDGLNGETFSGTCVVSFATENDQVLSCSDACNRPDDSISRPPDERHYAFSVGEGVNNVVDGKTDHEGIHERIHDPVATSEARSKKISWMEKSRHYCNTRDNHHLSCDRNSSEHEWQPTEINEGAKHLQSNKHKHQVLSLNGNETSLDRENHTIRCHVCSIAFEDVYLLLQHYRGHLEQRFHVCWICDAGFKTSENLDAHMFGHSEKPRHSLGIQTVEDQTCDLVLGESSIKNRICLRLATTSREETSKIPKDGIIPVTHLPDLDTGGYGSCFTQEGGIVSNPSQKCIMSSGQWSNCSSDLHQPSPSSLHHQLSSSSSPSLHHQLSSSSSSSLHHHTNTDPELYSLDRIKKSINEGMATNNSQPSHILLQPITNDDIIPRNTYFLLPSEIHNVEAASNSGEIFLYNPSASCLIMAAGRSLVGLTSAVDKPLSSSSLTLPIPGSKPL